CRSKWRRGRHSRSVLGALPVRNTRVAGDRAALEARRAASADRYQDRDLGMHCHRRRLSVRALATSDLHLGRAQGLVHFRLARIVSKPKSLENDSSPSALTTLHWRPGPCPQALSSEGSVCASI